MVEISTSILSVKKGEESKTFFALEKAKTDYFHIDVMDGKFVEKDTYQKMLEYASYIKRISNLPLDIHLMVEDINTAIDDFASVEPNIITFHYEACKNNEEVMEVIKKIKNNNCKVGISVKPAIGYCAICLSPTEINAPRGCAVILIGTCQLR